MRRCAIAVAGMSGSGKTTLAEGVARALGAGLLRTDDYYRPLDALGYAARCEVNFDHPDAVDGGLLAHQLRLLLGGEAVDVPEYDFTRHTRGARTRRVEATEFVVVEGIFALAYPEVVGQCAVRAFVDADEATCLGRRVARDVAERGRTPGEVVSRFEGHAAPMFRRHVLPSRTLATVTVSGERDPLGGVAAVLAALGRKSPLAA